jgi:hypothetical protein
MTLRLAEDHDRIAGGLDDIVARRLFSAGPALEAVLGLTGEHRAAGSIQHAISELDLAIRDFRNVLFDHQQPDSPPRRTALALPAVLTRLTFPRTG